MGLLKDLLVNGASRFIGKIYATGGIEASSLSGNGSGVTNVNASNISSGTMNADRLPTSGVTAGSAGPTAAVSGTNSIAVPRITVDNKGRVTGLTSYNYTGVNTTYSAATSSTLGLVKSGGDVTVGSDGTMTVTDDSHNHVISNVDGLQSALNAKLATSLKGAASGLAELDSTGRVPSSQLPSFVDDVVEGYLSSSKFYKTKGSDGTYSTEITGETGKIYIDLNYNKTYRWSGSAFVVISETLALGETSSTAYRGDRGKTAYDHSQATHARTDATKTAKSSTNGNILINGTETVVYTHPSGTNPHGTTKSDIGLGNVENKSSATIRGELTKENVTTALGYTPPTTNTTYSAATSSTLGLVKSGGDVTVGSDGTMTVTDDSHNHVISNVDGLQAALDGKAASSHNHNSSYYTKTEVDALIEEAKQYPKYRLMYDESQDLIYLDNADTELPNEVAMAVTKMNRTTEVLIPASGWSSSAPYTQQVAVSGMTSNDKPEVYLSYPSTVNSSNVEAYTEAFSAMHKFETLDGYLKITAFVDKPAVDVTVILKGV